MIGLNEELYFIDFVGFLRSSLEYSGWVCDIDDYQNGFRYIKVSSTGTSNQETMHYVISEFYDKDDDVYGVYVYMYTNYDSNETYYNQLNSTSLFLPLSYGINKAYINITANRAHIAVKVGDTYQTLSFGKLISDFELGQHDKNYYLLAPSLAAVRYNSAPNSFYVKAITPSGSIETVNTYPTRALDLQPDRLNDYSVHKILLYTNEQLGYIDGIEYVSGFANNSENTAFFDEKSYRVFCFNRLNSVSHYYIMESL